MALLLAAGLANAQAPNAARIEKTAAGPVLHFIDADFVRTDRAAIPSDGWRRTPLGRAYSFERMGKTSTTKILWVRLRFDRGALSAGPQALYAENNHERFVAYLNGREIHRTFTEGDARALGWYRPELVRLPADTLRPSLNTLLLRIESNYDLVSGRFILGAAPTLQSLHASRFFWRITGVQAANYAMAVVMVVAFMFWLLRKADIELLMVSLLSLAWLIRNHNFVAIQAPFAVVPFKLMTYYTVYPAMSASLAFCLVFARVKNFVGHAIILGIIGVFLCFLRLLTVDTGLVANFGSDTIGNSLAVGCAAYTAALLLRHWGRTGERAALFAFAGLLLVIAGTVHDVGRLWDAKAWDGLGFYIQPYVGSTFCLIMLLAFGFRAYRAFGAMESMNAMLETRVADARAELQISEARRRELEVARALESERERIMREMHDGIGSNLVAALSAAERQHHPPETVATLRRALSDLKLTVDSLEPFEGDLVALLGNFRHRAEPDLRAARVRSRWNVGEVRALPWLDPTNALHVLRLFQEALANALAHSDASEIAIGCEEEGRGGRDGALAWLTDNGRGIGPNAANLGGKGNAAMRARAEAIGGQFERVSQQGKGTTIRLWLPYERTTGLK